jgi:hypothetical protein
MAADSYVSLCFVSLLCYYMCVCLFSVVFYYLLLILCNVDCVCVIVLACRCCFIGLVAFLGCFAIAC